MKATNIKQVPKAVQFFVPVKPDDEFYTSFEDFRGDFEENVVYRKLFFDSKTQEFDLNYTEIKPFLFFVGMRGSGKTTELYKYQKKLDNPNDFFTVFCSLDEELDMNDLEYMDIIIFQLEKLIERLKDEKIKVKDDILKSMNKWFEERVMR